jgi:hypothetical protein
MRRVWLDEWAVEKIGMENRWWVHQHTDEGRMTMAQ